MPADIRRLQGPEADRSATLHHIPAIEGLRAIAVVAVLLFHLEWRGFEGGFLGVDLFFTLSGFLITRLLLAEFARTNRISLLRFYDRRFRRLLPAALVVIFVVACVEDVFGSVLTDPLRRSDVRSVLVYVANWHFIESAQDYFADGDVSPLRHMWSLAIEEQFYVVWPLVVLAVLLVARRRLVRGFRLLGCLAVALAAASAILFAVRYEPGQVSRAYYGTDTRVFQLLLGAVAATVERDAVARGATRVNSGVRHVVTTLCLVVVLVSIGVVDAQGWGYYHGLGVAFSSVSAVLVYQLGRLGSGWSVSLLGSRPLVFVGGLSYGIYLWHWPIFQWLSEPANATFLERRMVNLLQVAATLAAAFTSYHLIEHPIRSGRLLQRLPTVGRLATMAIPVLAVFMIGGRLLAPPPTDPILEALNDTSVTSCPNDEFPCVVADFRADGDGPTVAVVGDSTVQGLTMGILDVAEERGWRVVNAARGSCPIGHLLVQYGSGDIAPDERQVECHRIHDQIWADLVADYDPDVYLAGSISDRLPHVVGDELVLPSTDRHLAETREAMNEAFAELAVNGAPIVYVQSWPVGLGVACYAERGSEEACAVPRSDDDVNQPYHQMIHDIAAEFPTRFDVLDLTDHFCGPDVCPLRMDGVVTRYDRIHLTGTMSRRLGPLVVAALDATGALDDTAS